ncbi:MAG: ATP-binding protein [Prochloraceae cyanobacterium]
MRLRLDNLRLTKYLLWRGLPVLIGVSFSVATCWLWKALLEQDFANKQHFGKVAAASVKQELDSQLQNRFQALIRMERRWSNRGGMPQVEWEIDAQNYLRDYPGFQAIEWIDSEFNVRWIVPLAGNEAAQNLNLAFEPRRKAALEASRQRYTLTVTRTINLVQGGKGFLVYVPIFLKTSKTTVTPHSSPVLFDGFILGVFRIQSLLDTLLDQEKIAPGYALAILEGTEEIYRRSFPGHSSSIDPKWIQEKEIFWEGVTWHLRVWPTRELLVAQQSPLPRLVLSGGLVMAVLGTSAVHLAQTAQRRNQQVTIINQKLTQEQIEHQQASVKLQEKESTLRSFFNSSPLMMGIVELVEDDILDIEDNVTTAKFWGFTPEAMRNRLATTLGQPPAQVRQWIQYYRESQQTSSPVHFEYADTTGTSTSWLSATVCPIVRTTGNRVRFSYVVEDITVRKQAETILQQTKEELEILVAERTMALTQAKEKLECQLEEGRQAEANLQELESRWRTLLENVPLVVVGLECNGQVEYVNPFFLQLTGYVSGEVLSKNWFNIFVPQSQFQQAQQIFKEILLQTSLTSYQYSILSKSGAEKIISWNTVLLRNKKGEVSGTISIGLDITERHAIEKMKNEFIAVASHEMRTPLTSIHGILQLLDAGRLGKLSPPGQKMSNVALRNSQHLVNLVNDILDLERIESGQEKMEKQQCDSEELINQAVAMLLPVAQAHQVVLKTNSKSIIFWGDRERILQTLTNLISNAIKFSTADDQVWITSQQHHKNDQEILFAVKDFGRGIPSDKLESIFERFHQVDATDSRLKGGTGLGLAICRHIVEQHGGKIWVESILAEGSSFYFTFPLESSESTTHES